MRRTTLFTRMRPIPACSEWAAHLNVRVPKLCRSSSSQPVARFRPTPDLLGCYPCGLQPAIWTWAPGLPPTGQISSTPRDSKLPLTRFLFFSTGALLENLARSSSVILPELSCTLCWSPNKVARHSNTLRKVTSLDPPNAAPTGKLKKLSKNDYGFTPSFLAVNGKNKTVCALNSVECSWSTGVCSKTGAKANCRN